MDIEQVGSFYLNEARLPPTVSRKAGTPEAPGNGFSQVLETVQESSLSPAQTPKVSKKPKIDKTDKLYEQCEALETFLIKNLINGMRNTVEKSGFIDEGFAGKMYEDMLYDEYAKEYSKNADFGLAELAYLELTGQRGTVSQQP